MDFDELLNTIFWIEGNTHDDVAKEELHKLRKELEKNGIDGEVDESEDSTNLTPEQIEKMKKLACSFQYSSPEFIFSGNYTNDEIDYFIKETDRLKEIKEFYGNN